LAARASREEEDEEDEEEEDELLLLLDEDDGDDILADCAAAARRRGAGPRLRGEARALSLTLAAPSARPRARHAAPQREGRKGI
jgi:hypothetical protein